FHVTGVQTCALPIFRQGTRYDSDSLVFERESIYNMARRYGYFDFLRQYIRFEVDSNLRGDFVDLKLMIDNPSNKDAHSLFYIDSSFVEIQTSAGRKSPAPALDSLAQAIFFTDHTGRFKSRPLNRYIYQKKGNLYDINSENLTYDRLYELNTFKSIKVNYVKSDST